MKFFNLITVYDVLLMELFAVPVALITALALVYPSTLGLALVWAIATVCVATAAVIWLRVRCRTYKKLLDIYRARQERLETYIKEKRLAYYENKSR